MAKHEEVVRREGTFSCSFILDLGWKLAVRFTLTLVLVYSRGYTYDADLTCFREKHPFSVANQIRHPVLRPSFN
jgi:hypothetical protein